jgi:hypothetical protein
MPSFASLALCSLPLVLLAPRDTTLAFRVGADAKVTKTFESKLELELESMIMRQDGEDVPMDGEGAMEMSVVSSTKLVFADHYREMGAGRPKLLARTFDTLEGKEERKQSQFGESEGETRDETSELEGKTVLFTWKEDEERYQAQFEGDGGDSALLVGVVEDTDLRAFLPPKSVAEGDTWSVDAAAFDALVNPGGDVKLVSEDDCEDSDENAEELRKNISGKIAATFKGTREEGGATLAVIQLECEVATFSDGALGGEDEQEEGVEAKERLDIALELKGEILWNVAAGRAHSLALDGDAKVLLTYDIRGEYEGETFSFVQVLTLTGPSTFAATWAQAD